MMSFDDDGYGYDDDEPVMTHPQGTLDKMCSTCIYRPGNQMQLQEGRVEDMTEECHARDTNVVCHQSKNVGGDFTIDVWCRGSVDERPGQMVRIMDRISKTGMKEFTASEIKA